MKEETLFTFFHHYATNPKNEFDEPKKATCDDIPLNTYKDAAAIFLEQILLFYSDLLTEKKLTFLATHCANHSDFLESLAATLLIKPNIDSVTQSADALRDYLTSSNELRTFTKKLSHIIIYSSPQALTQSMNEKNLSHIEKTLLLLSTEQLDTIAMSLERRCYRHDHDDNFRDKPIAPVINRLYSLLETSYAVTNILTGHY
jgi:hypothetical protein